MNKETAELLSWFISLLFKSSSPAQIFITIHQEDPTALIESKLLPFISAQQGLPHSPEQRLVTTGEAPTAGDGAARVAGKSRKIFSMERVVGSPVPGGVQGMTGHATQR